MPNWCYNSVTFRGPREKIGELSDILMALKYKSEVENRGVLPDFIENSKEIKERESTLYLFDIECSKEEPENLIFSSRWSPALDTIHAIGVELGLDFEHYYDESSNLLYGVSTYNHKTGEFLDIYLEEEDYEKIDEFYDEDDDVTLYSFEDKDYEVKEEILEILLDRKIKSVNNNN